MRRLIGFAVALLAVVALSGCGIERLTGPQVDVASNRTGGTYSPVRDDDPKDPPLADPGGSIAPATDSLRTGADDAR